LGQNYPSPVENLFKVSILTENAIKCKISFTGPPKGTSLHETTPVDFLSVKIGAAVIGWR